jgi:tRNA dimethylallyltransferase
MGRNWPEAVLIAGPTASGKSALALEIAERLGGVVVNADSAQVYAELRIITARPSAQDEARVEHRLYGYRPAAAPFSVAQWLADMATVLADLHAAGRPAVIVGGTGLYFKALTEGLAEVPEIPPEVRAHWREQALSVGAEALHDELARRDPAMAARLRPSDAQRIARALEVIEATGRSLADWQSDPVAPALLSPARSLSLVVDIDRARLHDRINRRFETMVEAGAVDEARSFAALGLDPALPAARAIGVRPLVGVASGELGLASAIERGQAESRQYAKRQVTWLRNQMPDWRRVPPEISVDDLLTRSFDE